MRPSTIFSMMFSGLPLPAACSRSTAFSRSSAAGSTAEMSSASGRAAATCMPTWRPSVSSASSSLAPSSATSTPILPRPGRTALWT
jgi:hypothetical protein